MTVKKSAKILPVLSLAFLCFTSPLFSSADPASADPINNLASTDVYICSVGTNQVDTEVVVDTSKTSFAGTLVNTGDNTQQALLLVGLGIVALSSASILALIISPSHLYK